MYIYSEQSPFIINGAYSLVIVARIAALEHNPNRVLGQCKSPALAQESCKDAIKHVHDYS